MNYTERLTQAVDYAIETDYSVYNRALEIKKDLQAHKNVCVFGTGEFFRDCADEEHHLTFQYVGDNNPSNWGKYFKGKKCLSPQEIAKIEDVVVIIIIGEWRPVYEQLTNMGITCYPMDWYMLNVYDTHYSKEWFAENYLKIMDTVNLFADDISKEVYVEAICNRIAPKYAKKIFNEIKIPGEYFETDVFSLGEEECFVDAGAYKGDTVEKFVKAVKGKYKAIYSFELDSSIFKELREVAEKYDMDKIEIFNAGVSDVSGDVQYVYTGIDKKTEKLVALDDVLMNKPVTFIKMDVETFEIKALEGAKGIIKNQKPKLAISAYHYLSDLWEIPKKIKEIQPLYKLYLRHHAPVVWDTDCYAVC